VRFHRGERMVGNGVVYRKGRQRLFSTPTLFMRGLRPVCGVGAYREACPTPNRDATGRTASRRSGATIDP
jgi:hypothetical protein